MEISMENKGITSKGATAFSGVKESVTKQKRLQKKLTDYGVKLAAKQLIKYAYNDLREKEMSKVFKNALIESTIKSRSGEHSETSVGKLMYQALESRLEVVLTKMGGAISLGHARQKIGHGKVYVNGRRVKERGYTLSKGDSVRWID